MYRLMISLCVVNKHGVVVDHQGRPNSNDPLRTEFEFRTYTLPGPAMVAMSVLRTMIIALRDFR